MAASATGDADHSKGWSVFAFWGAFFLYDSGWSVLLKQACLPLIGAAWLEPQSYSNFV